MPRSAPSTSSIFLGCFAVSSALAACSGDTFSPAAGGAGGTAGGVVSGGRAGLGGAAIGGAGIGGGGGSATGGASAGAGAGGAAGAGKAGTGGLGASGNAGTGNGGAPSCTSDETCQALAGPCRAGTCKQDRCAFEADDTRLPPPVPNDCRDAICKDGKPDKVLNLADVPDPAAPCSVGVCKPDGGTGTMPGNDGKVCAEGRFFNDGSCVECTDEQPCPTYGPKDCRNALGCKAGLCETTANPNAKPDDQPDDCIEKVCLADGSVGESFSGKGEPCSLGTLPGRCSDAGTCEPLISPN